MNKNVLQIAGNNNKLSVLFSLDQISNLDEYHKCEESLSKCEEIHNIMIVDRTGFLTVSKSGSGMELYSSQISRMFSSNFIASFALSVIFETSLN